MKILITGAAGGIGSTLSHVLHKNKFDLVLVDNLRNGYIENLYNDGQLLPNFKKIDIISDEFSDLVKNEKPDVIIHLAAITSLPECELKSKDCFDINVKGTLSILSLARSYGVKKVIFGSTSAVYENTNMDSDGYSESDTINPLLFYSLSKKISEDICHSFIKNYGLDVVILRFSNVLGPKQDLHRKSPPVINYLVKEFFENRIPILHSNGEQKRDYIYVDDVVNIIIKIISEKKVNSSIINVCSSTLISLNEIVDSVKKGFGNSELKVYYRESDKLWDSYPGLFEGSLPLKKEVVKKETNKICLLNNSVLINELNIIPNKNIPFLVEEVTKEIIQHLKNQIKN